MCQWRLPQRCRLPIVRRYPLRGFRWTKGFRGYENGRDTLLLSTHETVVWWIDPSSLSLLGTLMQQKVSVSDSKHVCHSDFCAIQLSKENIVWSQIEKECLHSDQCDSWICDRVDSTDQIPLEFKLGFPDKRGKYRFKYDGATSQFELIFWKFPLTWRFPEGKSRAS